MKQKFLPSKNFKIPLVFAFFVLSFANLSAQSGPELVFQNPVLVSGQPNKQGAKYRFNNVTTGVDAVVLLKKFSRNDIVMSNIDLPNLGWAKAFQPQFGVPGVVQPFQQWYIDFDMTFYKAGTNQKQRMDTIDLTALDVDGDGWSVAEYVVYNNPSSISYATVSYLASNPTSILGQLFTCDICILPSILETCDDCDGSGVTNSGSGNNNECDECHGSGLTHALCGHAYEGATGTTIQGPVENFVNIDTLATQVMATYQYRNKDNIKFRMGARSYANSSNGSGIRLNSTWFREFSLAPPIVLPVKLMDFAAKLDNSKVNLGWTTAQEKHFSHFVVQRSTDGQNFNDIGVVFTAGRSGSRADYSLIDGNLENKRGLLYYRLQMVDADKQTSYSAVRIIRLGEEKTSFTLTTYPNPAVNQLRVTIPAAWQGKEVKIELLNGSGQAVKLQKSSNASQAETINVAELGRGIYFIKATCGNESAQQRILKN